MCEQSARRAFTGFYSGRINTLGKVNLKHGVIEARVRLAATNPYAWCAPPTAAHDQPSTAAGSRRLWKIVVGRERPWA